MPGDTRPDQPVDRSFVEQSARTVRRLVVNLEREPGVVDAGEDERFGGRGRDALRPRNRCRHEDALDGRQRRTSADGADERDDPADELAGEPARDQRNEEELAVADDRPREVSDRPPCVGRQVREVVFAAERREGGSRTAVVDLGRVQVVGVLSALCVVGRVEFIPGVGACPRPHVAGEFAVERRGRTPRGTAEAHRLCERRDARVGPAGGGVPRREFPRRREAERPDRVEERVLDRGDRRLSLEPVERATVVGDAERAHPLVRSSVAAHRRRTPGRVTPVPSPTIGACCGGQYFKPQSRHRHAVLSSGTRVRRFMPRTDV